MPCPISGVIAPLLTPFEDDFSLADALYAEHARRLLAQGMHYLTPFGSTGEALSLSAEERMQAVDGLIAAGIPADRLIPGAGLCNMADTLRLCEHAIKSGCRGVMTLPPFFYKYADDDGLYRYFADLFAALDAPLLFCLYHIPPLAGMGFSPALTRRLAQDFPNHVAAYKDSSGDFAHTRAVREAAPQISVMTGSEEFLTRGLAMGAGGCISATCNINPQGIRRVYDLATAGQPAAAADEKMIAVRRQLDGAAPVPMLKALTALITGERRWYNTRPPLLPCSAEQAQTRLANMRQYASLLDAD